MTSLPETMTAIAIREPGGPEVLVPETRPVPQPGPGELLIRVAAAGVNRPDVLQRMGFYPPPPGASDLPGLEVAGSVVAVGPGGDSELLGQSVCALVAGGGYAEYCVAPAGSCLPVPQGFSMAEAAALPETVFTVWHNLFERGYVREGETALIHGGTSGIGTTAIGLAKLFGIRIIVTCGSADKCDAARALGADLAIDYSTEDYVEAVKAFTGGKGVEVVLDMVGGDYVPRNLDCLADDGRHVSIAFQRGMKAEVDISQLMRRRLTMTGSTLRARSADFKALLADEIHKTLWPRLAEGGWKPAMDQSFPLAEAAAAHARMQAGEHVGKIVLTVK
ncbi:NAD(P)H-quinone oxidoreductase [Sphingopyxis sp.]|uniref:NAD(P)H-quinone oxidoreductase n=1 Tax=Sphingopyxis sp. TaxID=1908224 RepID=UPI0035B07208